MASNYTVNTPTDIMLDGGLLYAGSTPVGVTRGGTAFDPGKKIEQIAFDGQRAGIAGMDRVVDYTPTIKAKILAFGTGSIPQYDAAGTNTFTTSSLGNGISNGTYTPVSASAYFTVGQYVTGLRLIAPRGAGGYAEINFPLALCTSYKVAFSDTKEAEIDATFEARLQMTGSVTTDTAPYFIKLHDNLLT